MRPTTIALLSISCALRLRTARAADALVQEGVWLEEQRGPGTEQCIDAPSLKRGVEARLHRAVFSDSERASLRILLALERHRHAWSAKLELRNDAGERLGQRTIETEAAHCSSLDDSLALVLALLVDAPLTAQVEAAKARQPAPPIAAAPTSTPVPRPQGPPDVPAPTILHLPPNTYATREPWRVETELGATLALGALPGAAFGVDLGFALKPAHAPGLRIFGGAYQRRDARSGSAGAHFTALHLGLEICPLETQFGKVRGSACAGQSLGTLHAAAFGYDQNSSTTRLSFALLARGALVVPLTGPFSAHFSARAELPLTREVFLYGTREAVEATVYQVSPVAGVFEAGFLVAL